VLLAPDYAAAGTVIGILAFSFVFIGLKFVAAVGLTIVKDNRPIGLAVTASGALFILLSVLLVPRLGLSGAAWATLISQATIPLFLFWRAQLVYRIPYNFGLAALLLALAGGLSYAGSFVTAEGLAGFLTRIGLLLLIALSGLLLRTRAADPPAV
jgi:O-antigen/teichoic acid export membrane protein